jgi:hypothetical protein
MRGGTPGSAATTSTTPSDASARRRLQGPTTRRTIVARGPVRKPRTSAPPRRIKVVEVADTRLAESVLPFPGNAEVAVMIEAIEIAARKRTSTQAVGVLLGGVLATRRPPRSGVVRCGARQCEGGSPLRRLVRGRLGGSVCQARLRRKSAPRRRSMPRPADVGDHRVHQVPFVRWLWLMPAGAAVSTGRGRDVRHGQTAETVGRRPTGMGLVRRR